MLFPGGPLQFGPISVSKGRSIPCRGALERCSSQVLHFWSRVVALLTEIGLGWKSLPGTRNLAF